MRYTNLTIDMIDRDYIDFANPPYEGHIVLDSTDELIDLTNQIRKEQGNYDLVRIDYDNDVYYNFYLAFNTTKKEISIQAICNYGEKDDEVWYQLPMTKEEERHIMFLLIECLGKELDDRMWR